MKNNISIFTANLQEERNYEDPETTDENIL